MTKKVLLATNNPGKVERFKKLVTVAGLNVEFLTPAELEIETIDVPENGKTLVENAEIKARAYFGKVDIPILANDTGFWLSTEGFFLTPKREALGAKKEEDLTVDEVNKMLLDFWKDKATQNGGEVDAAWVEFFVLLKPDGEVDVTESRREAILTNKEFGDPPAGMPIRALYISKITNKPAVLHTEADEIQEMQPVIGALKQLLV